MKKANPPFYANNRGQTANAMLFTPPVLCKLLQQNPPFYATNPPFYATNHRGNERTKH